MYRCLLAALVTLTTVLSWAWASTAWAADSSPTVKVGSNRFTESYVLGELVRTTLERAGVAAEHRQGLGNTAILEQALRSGQIDVYPEYTGTIVRELLKRQPSADAPPPTLAELNHWLAPMGLKADVPVGFNNTYALALREADAQRLALTTLSDLARLAPAEAARLRLGLSHEFLVRADGWQALKRSYGLPLADPPALDHGLAYKALENSQVDLIDVYSTDAQISRLGLRVLKDDRGFFPRYDAVLLMRADLSAKAQAALQPLKGRIDEARMIELNAAVEMDGRNFAEVARQFLDGPAGASGPLRTSLWGRLWEPDLGRLLLQHLGLVVGSVLLAVAVGVPMGMAVYRRERWAQWVLAAVGLLQTVPSLALLAFLIAAMGQIGFAPALIALCLYALLPIVSNTIEGLAGVSEGQRQAGHALGLNSRDVLRHVELPQALPTLLAGVATAAVINVGTATMAAFVGAGGLGERIVAGLAVNDIDRMLAGAIPAALLALLVQGLFAALKHGVARTPLRAERQRSEGGFS
jgi:osmoprotectant transport system permease protein